MPAVLTGIAKDAFYSALVRASIGFLLLGPKQAADKRSNAVILSGSEGSAFEYSANYRFFVARWRLSA